MVNNVTPKDDWESGVDKIIKAVTIKQKELNLSENGMAKRLGISRASLYLYKKKQRKPTLKFMSAVASEFPELQLLIFGAMTEKKR